MIDLSKLKELVALMSQNDLSEVALKDGDEQITIRRGGQPVMMMGAASPVQHVASSPSFSFPMPPKQPRLSEWQILERPRIQQRHQPIWTRGQSLKQTRIQHPPMRLSRPCPLILTQPPTSLPITCRPMTFPEAIPD